MDLQKTARAVNMLASFLGRRDIRELTKKALTDAYQISEADLLILIGGSILYGGDVAAAGMREGVAKKLMLVGGAGHTTESFRQRVAKACPGIVTKNMTEADLFDAYIENRYGIVADLKENTSTNCGNNVTNTLAVWKEQGISPKSIIFIHDCTMQRRMDATFRKYLGPEVRLINFAAYYNPVTAKDGRLVFQKELPGMWDMEHYVSLLLGEIPRLLDNGEGYGPRGKDFIAHVDIPEEILDAFTYLKQDFGSLVRTADPAYASQKEGAEN